MGNNNLHDLEPFPNEKAVNDLGKSESGGKTSSVLMVKEHLSPEEFAILTRTKAANRQGILDEMPPYSHDVLDQFKQMMRS